MSAFKDMVAEDTMSVFLDPDFFADTHLVNGQEILCIFDSVGSARSDDYGIAQTTHALYAATSDLPRRRPAGSTLSIDRRPYLVVDWQDNMGITTIHLSQAEGM